MTSSTSSPTTVADMRGATTPRSTTEERDVPTRLTAEGQTGGTDRVELQEEQLRATTRPVQAGEVRVTTEVVSEEQSLNVPVTHEEVYIERHAVNRPATDADFGREELRVPVSREEVDLQKQAVVREEIEVGKRPVQETQTVHGTVRHEEAHLEQSGDVAVHGWEAAAAGYRQRWQPQPGSSGGRFEDEEPGYRYGYEMANDPRYQGRS